VPKKCSTKQETRRFVSGYKNIHLWYLDRFSQNTHTLLKMNFNIILPPELISSKEVLPLGLPIKILYAFLIFSMFCLSRKKWLGIIITIFFMQFPAPFCSCVVQPNTASAPCPKHLESMFSCQWPTRQVTSTLRSRAVLSSQACAVHR